MRTKEGRGEPAVKTHLTFSSELDPNSVLRFVLVICRAHSAGGEWCLLVGNTHPQPMALVVDCMRRFWRGALIGNDAKFGIVVDIPGLGSNATFRLLWP